MSCIPLTGVSWNPPARVSGIPPAGVKRAGCMAQQDVRYYLNGMLLEKEGKSLRAVATDGHRLALCETELDTRNDDELRNALTRVDRARLTSPRAG